MKKDPHVFICYTRKDGERIAIDLVRKLEEATLGDKRIHVWRDKDNMRGGEGWWKQIEDVLHQVDFVLLLITPGVTDSEIVPMEWRKARKLGVCILPVFASDGIKWKELPLYLQKTHCYNLKKDWSKIIKHLNGPCRQIREPFMVGELPPDFVYRSGLHEKLISYLVDEKRGAPKAITAKLTGAGGFGKTTMALALCHDERVRYTFFDGILWVTLGENPGDLTLKIQEWIDELSSHWPDYRKFSNITNASNHLRDLLKEKNMLIVIDDIWNESDAQEFLIGGSKCSWLLTTRNRDTLPVNSLEINVDEMEMSEALQVLGANMPYEDMRIEFEKLATRLGEWPLLLKLVNRILFDRYGLSQTLGDSLNAVEKLLDEEGLTAFDRRDAKQRNQAVAKTVGASLKLLKPEEHARFEELACFPEEVSIPIETVGRLWHETANLNETKTEDLCIALYKLSLLQDCNLSKRSISLHDVIRTYLRYRIGKEQIRILNNTLINAHHYRDLTAMPENEPYLWKYLVTHLIEAEQIKKLTALLSHFHWIKSKLEATDILALLQDYQYFSSIDLTKQKRRVINLLHRALRLAAPILVMYPEQLSTQFIGRLIIYNDPAVLKVIQEARESLPPKSLEPLTPSLRPAGGQLLQVLAESGAVSEIRVVNGTAEITQRAVGILQKNKIILWDLNTGNVIYRIEQKREGNTICTTHPLLPQVVIGYNGRLLLLDAMKGTFINEKDSGNERIDGLAVSKDGKMLCSVQDNWKLCFWSLPDLKLVNEIPIYKFCKDVSYVSDSYDVYVGTKQIELHTVNGKISKRYITNNRQVETMTVSQSGKYIAASLGKGEIFIFSSDKTQYVLKIKTAVKYYCESLCFLSDKHLAGSVGASLIVWDISKNGSEVLNIQTSSKIYTMDTYANGTRAITGHKSLMARTWDLKATELPEVHGHTNSITGLVRIKDNMIVTSSIDGTAALWDMKTGKRLAEVTGNNTEDELYSIGFDNDLIIAISQKCIYSIELDLLMSKQDKFKWSVSYDKPGQKSKKEHVLSSKNGVIVLAANKTVFAWNPNHWKRGRKFVLDSKISDGPFVSHNGQIAVVGLEYGSDGYAIIDFSTMKSKTIKLKNRPGQHNRRSWPWLMFIDKQVQKIALGYFNGNLEVRNLWNGEIINRFDRVHNDRITALSFSNDGRSLCSASNDGLLRIWDLKNEECLYVFGEDSGCNQCILCDDEGMIVAGDYDGGLHFLRMHE